MGKTSGLGDQLYVGGYDLSGDVGAINSIGGGPALLDVTAINKDGHERIGGVRSGQIDFSTWFDPETIAGGGSIDGSHTALKGLPTADVQVMYGRGSTLGNPGAAMIAKQVNYDGNRGNDASFPLNVQALSNGYGLEWGTLHTAGKRTDTGATAGTGVDGTAGTNYGLQAYLQVFSFDGVDATIKLQESSDNGTDPWADVTGGGFTAVTTAPGTQRIATATNLAVERYLRVTTTTVGGITSLVFAVVVVRNLAVPVF